MKKNIYIEMDLSGYGIDICDEGPWQGLDMLVAEGSTFEELLDNATIGFLDQDGGEGRIAPFDGSYLTSNQYADIVQDLASEWAKEIDKVLSKQGGDV